MYFLWHFRLIFSGCLHFPFDFQRAWLLFCDFPAFPSVCPLFSPAVLRLQSHLRRGILLAHHGYTGQQRYGQAKSAHEMGKGFAYPSRKSPTPIVQDEKKDPIGSPKRAIPDFPQKREKTQTQKSKTPKASPPLNDSAPPPQTRNRKRSSENGSLLLGSSRIYIPQSLPVEGWILKKPLPPRRRLDTEETASSP